MTWRLIILLTIAAAAHGAAPDPLGGILGSTDASAVTGNGGLTVTVNPSGRVTGCRWPSPGYFDQLTYDPASDTLSQGLLWGVEVDGQAKWLTGALWRSEQRYASKNAPIIETVSTSPDSPLQVTQTAFVHPKLDVLVLRIAVRGLTKSPRFLWYANITPCTRLIPEWPFADGALDATNDFAVFAADEGKTIYHFRPEKPHSMHWRTAREFIETQATAEEWASAFRDGVWIAYGSPEPVTAYQCGVDGKASSAFMQANAGAMANNAAAVGQCDSALTIQGQKMGDTYVATLLLAAGEDQAAAAKLLDQATTKAYDTLRQETEEAWSKRLGTASLPAFSAPPLQAIAKQCLITLLTAQDKQTGGMVRVPVAQPPLALDWPRHGAWATYALDLAGYHSLAEKHTLFYAEAVRAQGAPGKPTGSLPAAVYTDGQDALPHLILDTDATAWTLWSFWQHAEQLPADKRTAYTEKIWNAADLSGTFLTSWADGHTRQPLHSFNPEALRDTQGTELLITASMGVGNALRIADALGHERTDWRARKTEIDDLLRSCCLDPQEGWTQERPIPYWPAEILPKSHAAWDAITARDLARLETLSGTEALRTVCNVALLWRGDPDKCASLRPVLDRTLERVLYCGRPVEANQDGISPIVPDALHAALAYIALDAVYSAAP